MAKHNGNHNHLITTPSHSNADFLPLIVAKDTQNTSEDVFNPEKHLAFDKAPKVHSMKDIRLPVDKGVSPIAVSDPFPLFNHVAVLRMREEVLRKEVFENCQFSSNLSHCQLRGYASKYAPFVYDAWKHPETIRIISSVAGVDLALAMDYEIGHVNVSVKPADQNRRAMDEATDPPIVGWHTDSYPFVCVIMLSDCTEMVGGETALLRGDGEILKVRGPQMGCAVVLQGRYIQHQALAALGAAERITMVTSFRPRSAFARDDTVLTTVRPVSYLPSLYGQFSEYRLEMLEARVREQLKRVREVNAAGGRGWDTKGFKLFLAAQEAFLAHMRKEMVDDGDVVSGVVDESHLLTVKSVVRETNQCDEANVHN